MILINWTKLLNFKRVVIFLDYDGSIIKDDKALSFYRGVMPNQQVKKALVNLSKHARLVIITNQNGGYINAITKNNYKRKLRDHSRELFLKCEIDAIGICIHHPNATNLSFRSNCKCRKPQRIQSYLILKIFGGSPKFSMFIGNRLTDAETAKNLGISKCNLILNDRLLNEIKNHQSQKTNNKILPFSISKNFLSSLPDTQTRIDIKEEKNIAFLILAAGMGTRMGIFSEKVPKPLSKVANKSILERQIGIIRNLFPKSTIFVNVHHHANQFIEEILRIDAQDNLVLIYEKALLGSNNTLYEITRTFKENLVVLHGDILFDSNYFSNFVNGIKNPNRSYLCVHKREAGIARSLVKTQNNVVVEYENNPRNIGEKEVFVNSGFYYFSKKDFGLIESFEERVQVADKIISRLISKSSIEIIHAVGFRKSIETYDDLTKVQELDFDIIKNT